MTERWSRGHAATCCRRGPGGGRSGAVREHGAGRAPRTRRERSREGCAEAPRCAGTLARPCSRRCLDARVRVRGEPATRGAAVASDCRHRPDRGRPRARAWGRADSRAGDAHRRSPVAGGAPRPADARPLPLWPPGRRARRLPRNERAPERGARLEPGRELQALERKILQHDQALDGSRASTLEPSGVVVCPFKGLASFAPADAAYFFGRERLVGTSSRGSPPRRSSGSSDRRGVASRRSFRLA